MQKQTRIITYAAIVLGVFIGIAMLFLYILKDPKNESEGRTVNLTLPLVERISQETQLIDEGFTFYVNPQYKFTLQHPNNLYVEKFGEGGLAETILFRHPTEQVGFQILITPFEYEEEVLTYSLLLKTLPMPVINEPQEVVTGGGKRALVFWSEASEIGKTREVWFIHTGYLYGITTYANLDSWLARIMSTWRFLE